MTRSGVSIVFLLVLAPAFGQPTAFEVASVKVSTAAGTRSRIVGGPGTSDPSQISFTNVTLAALILRAYDMKSYQLSAPDWVASKRYDVMAKLPEGATPEQFRGMLRNLLAERFHLALHHESRTLAGFQLVVGRGWHKLRASGESGDAVPVNAPEERPKTDANGFPILDRPGLVIMEGIKGKSVVVFLRARAQAVSALVDLLSREFRQPILDGTGLTGRYDFTLEFAPQPPGALTAAPPDAADDSAPNLITAVQQQLGLRLNGGKVPLDVLVIEKADPSPTEN